MRLWHKDLIPVLPKQQLIAQWRECCCIARNIAVKGTPNHLLVNDILNYDWEHFDTYCFCVREEMLKRGYKISKKSLDNFESNFEKAKPYFGRVPLKCLEIYGHWHIDRYLRQCYYNLQEKYDCGGISKEEWDKIEEFVIKRGITNGKA